MAVMIGCQGRDKTPTIKEKICPTCGHIVELFSTDVEVECEHCGTIVYNDALSCVQWCKYAKQCVGEEQYEQLMEIARQQKERQKAAKEAEAAGLQAERRAS